MRTSVVIGVGVALALAGSIALRSTSRVGKVELADLNFTLKDMSGKDVRLADLKGHPILLNFWATWCGPCRAETPELVALAAKYRDQGLVILGVSFDDTPEQMRRFADEFKVNYPLLVGRDHEDFGVAYGLGEGIPLSIFIRRDGSVMGRILGIGAPSWLEKQVQALL